MSIWQKEIHLKYHKLLCYATTTSQTLSVWSWKSCFCGHKINIATAQIRLYSCINTLSQTPSKTQTNKRTDRHARLSDCPLCLSRASILWRGGDKTRCSWKFKGGWNPGSTNKYRQFGQLIMTKIIKINATKCHINAKMQQIRFLVSVRLSVRLSVCLDTWTAHLHRTRSKNSAEINGRHTTS